MSKLFIKQIDEHESKEELFRILLETIKGNQIGCDLTKINRAYDISRKAYEGIKRYSGDDYITHPIHVAIILAEMGAGENAIIAGLMCDILLKTNVDVKMIEKSLSPEIAFIVKGVSDFQEHNHQEQEEITLVKLAERLHNMRTLKYMDESKWKVKAKETLEIYMPIARKMGNKALMEEMNKITMDYA